MSWADAAEANDDTLPELPKEWVRLTEKPGEWTTVEPKKGRKGKRRP